MIFALLNWSGTEHAIFLSYACVSLNTLLIYLIGFSRGMQDLLSSLQHSGPFIAVLELLVGSSSVIGDRAQAPCVGSAEA